MALKASLRGWRCATTLKDGTAVSIRLGSVVFSRRMSHRSSVGLLRLSEDRFLGLHIRRCK
jgi:hypothetical protein